MYGVQDRGSAAERAAIAKERFPNLNLHMLDGCKHLIPYDKPREMAELIVLPSLRVMHRAGFARAERASQTPSCSAMRSISQRS